MKMIAAAALALMAAGLGAVPGAAGPTVIEMTDTMVFQPRELSVTVGEVVVWKNVSKTPHSVNTVPDNCKTEAGRKWVKVPAGAVNLYSGEVPPDKEFRVRFELPGVYQYLCTSHEDESMQGTIFVEGAKVR